MLNQVVLIGRLTHDPELRYTPGNGVPVTTFAIAVERPFTNREGIREADFIKIVAWRKQAEACANHLRKGLLVAVAGRLQIRNYEDSEGNKRKATEVVADQVKFLEWARSGSESGESPDSSLPGDEMQVGEDDIPF